MTVDNALTQVVAAVGETRVLSSKRVMACSDVLVGGDVVMDVVIVVVNCGSVGLRNKVLAIFKKKKSHDSNTKNDDQLTFSA